METDNIEDKNYLNTVNWHQQSLPRLSHLLVQDGAMSWGSHVAPCAALFFLFLFHFKEFNCVSCLLEFCYFVGIAQCNDSFIFNLFAKFGPLQFTLYLYILKRVWSNSCPDMGNLISLSVGNGCTIHSAVIIGGCSFPCLCTFGIQ